MLQTESVETKKDLVYFPGLNALRFIAAAAVIFFHTEHRKHIFQRHNLFAQWNFLEIVGQLGVTLFFVISGFLITYLLLKEREKKGTISVKSFYVRRILRIWPLYYLITILAFFVLCNIPAFDIPFVSTEPIETNFAKKLVLFLLFLPNAAFVAFGHVAYAKQSWSVGVEEQFYLCWPWIVKCARTFNQLMFALLLVLVIFVGGRYGLEVLKETSFGIQNFKVLDFTSQFLALLRFGCMAFGAIGAALLFYQKNPALKFIYHPLIQILTYGTLIWLFANAIQIPWINDEAYAVLFLIAAMNICSNQKSFLKLNYPIFDFLGKISYGLYMFHEIVIISSVKFLMSEGFQFLEWWENILLYSMILTGSVALSYSSYRLLESPFLKLKAKFTTVLSGNEGKELLAENASLRTKKS